MKKYNKILKISGIMFLIGVVIVIITVYIAGGFYSYSLNSNGFNIYLSEFNSTNVENILLDEFDSVNIWSVSDEIKFIPANEFRIEYNLDDRFYITKCEVRGKTLNFEYSMPKHFFGFNPSVSEGFINIYYDESINDGNFDEIKINSIQSNIDFSNINSVDEIDINSVSNDIEIDVVFSDLVVNMVSGDVEVINLGDNVKKINIKTVSGDVDVTLKDNNVDIKIETLSGKNYQNGDEFKKEYKALNGKVDISVNSVSGDFNFNY